MPDAGGLPVTDDQDPAAQRDVQSTVAEGWPVGALEKRAIGLG